MVIELIASVGSCGLIWASVVSARHVAPSIVDVPEPAPPDPIEEEHNGAELGPELDAFLESLHREPELEPGSDKWWAREFGRVKDVIDEKLIGFGRRFDAALVKSRQKHGTNWPEMVAQDRHDSAEFRRIVAGVLEETQEVKVPRGKQLVR